MTKVRKQKKGKKYRYGVNRKRLNKKITKIPKIMCEQIQEAYEDKKTMIQNMCEMGLSFNVNKTIQLKTSKDISSKMSFSVEDKSFVAKDLEADAREPRPNKFRLPQSRVDWLCKLIDKYGSNYRSMSLDQKLNPFQETWKQIRAKIRQFKKIPHQWNPYIKSKMQTTDL